MNKYKIYEVNNVVYIVLAFVTIIPILTSVAFQNGKTGNVLEYCSGDIFHPMCSENEILVMCTGRYGHIQLGRCVDADFGHLGCAEDKLKYLDERCSGRQECEIVVSDTEMKAELPCASALVRYLEASYSCQKVSQTENCDNLMVKSTTNYLSSHTSQLSECGHETAPLKLEAKSGQQINISMIDFNWQSNDKTHHHKCPNRYGYIIDVEHNKVQDICGGSERIKHVYLSEGSNLQVVISSNSNSRFMLSYHAVGCPLFTNPPNTWIKQEEQTIIVGCKQNEQTWKMRCIGNNWIGLLGNCTKAIPVSYNTVQHGSNQEHIFGMSSVVALSLIASVFVIIICIAVTTILGFFCIRQHKEPNEKFHVAPMTLLLDNTLSHANGQYPQHDTMETISRNNVVNNNATIQSSNFPQYFVLENRDQLSSEPVYDAVYQNVND